MCAYSYSKGVENSMGRQISAQAEKADAVQAETNACDASAPAVSIATQAYLWGALPPIELRTHDTRERLRTIYRDARVPPDR